MKVNRIVVVMATLMLVLSVVASGCGPKATPAPAEPTEAPPAAPTEAPAAATPTEAAAEEKVTLTFWHVYGPEMAGANSWFNDMIASFEKEYPNIHIEQEVTPNDPYKVKLKTAIAAGEAADAFMVYSGGWAEPYAKDGAILPLDKYLDEGGWRDNWISGGLDQMTWDGKTYGITTVLRTVHIWYNKEVYEKYNLEPPETMAELKEMIKTLRDNGVTPFALGNKERWQGNFWTSYLFARLGGYEAWKNAVDRKGNGWADPSHVEALALLQELVEMGAFTEGTNGVGAMDVNNSFFTGEAAMILNGTFFVDQVKSLAPEGFLEEKLGYFNFPVVEGGKGSANDFHGGAAGTFVVNSKTEHPDEVIAFYRFLTKPENLKELSGRTNWVTTVKGTTPEDASPLLLSLAKEAEKMEHLVWYADSAMVPAVFESYADATQAVFGLSITPEEAVAKMEEAATKELGPPSGEAAAPAVAPVVTEEEVTLTFWHIYGPDMAGASSWFKDSIAAFEEKYPSIHIEEEITPNDPYKVKLMTAIAAGEAADGFMVYAGGWTEPYARDGAILPVDKYLDEGGWRDNYTATAFDELTWDGKTYGFPLALRTVHIWYNKEVFDKYGLEPVETMSELKDMIKTLKDNGVTPFALGNKERWQGSFWTNYLFARVGGYEAWYNAVTREGNGWADPSHVEALALLQELVEMGAFTEGTNGVGAMDVNNSFFTGEAAMILNGTFFVDQVKSLAPEGFLENNLGYFNFPVIEGGKGGAKDYHGGVGSAFVINSKSEHPDEVAAFYRFIFTPENLTELSRRTNWVMTAKDTIPDDASPLLLSLAKEVAGMEHLIWYGDHAMLPPVWTAYLDATQATFGLSITPEEAVAKMEEAAKKEYGQ